MKLVSSIWLLAIAIVAVENSEISLNYRLPNETYPLHYGIKVATNVHLGKRDFQGKVDIDIVVVSTTSSIVLHARQLKIGRVNILNYASGKREKLSHEYELEREFLTLKRKNGDNFEAGGKWKLTILYSGQLRDDNGGFYMSSYVDENGEERYTALTQLESTDARHAFPCYDEPAIRANFTITINHSPKYTAISNMPVNEALSRPGKTVFLTTAPIPTYIVGYVVSDFEYTEGISDGIRHRVYSRSSKKNEQEFSLLNGMRFVNYFSQYFGVDYMLPKLDHVGVTDFKSAGMENWGMATYPEENLLFNEENAGSDILISGARYVAHEISHQWFGDYVTIKWWNTLWLKEGFATLFSYKAMNHVYPEWDIWQSFHVNDYLRSMTSDEVPNPRPITFDLEKPSDISNIYDETSYMKACSVLLMWNKALGEQVFQRAVQNFLMNNAYSSATEEDLLAEMEKSAKDDYLSLPASMSEMMSTWTKQGGLPILTVTRDYSHGNFTVKQEAYYKDETIRDNKTWYIPINFATASNADFQDTRASHYSHSTEIKIDANLAEDDWVIFNKRSDYYYRIKYDSKNYNLITKTLVEDPLKIHTRNRARLLDDARELCFSNRLDHAILLKMLTYVQQEDQYAPLHAAAKVFDNYHKYLKNKPYYQLFVSDLITPILQQIGVNKIPGEHFNERLARSTVITTACKAGVKECLTFVKEKLKDHIQKNITVEKDLHVATFGYSLVAADDSEFNFFYEQLLTESPDENLPYYLGFVQTERHIEKLTSSTMSNKLRPSVRYAILKPLYSRSEKGLLACIEFLNENWEAYVSLQKEDSNPLDADIRNMAKHVLNTRVEEKLINLIRKVSKSKYVTESLEADVNKTITKNYQWLERNEDNIRSWITQYLHARHLLR